MLKLALPDLFKELFRDTYDLERGVYRSAYEVLYKPREISSKTLEANLKSGKNKKPRKRSISSSESNDDEDEDSSDSEDERVKRKAKPENKEVKKDAARKKAKKKTDKKEKKDKKKTKAKKADYEPRIYQRPIPMVDPYAMYYY